MYTLYWAPGSSSMAPQAMLEEAGARYELRMVDTSLGVPRDPELLKHNPGGKVPTLVIDGRLGVYEAAAIVMWLAERHPATGLAPASSDELRGPYLQWLAFLCDTVQPAYLRWYYPDRHTADPAGAEGVRAKAAEDLEGLWTRIDRALEPGPYLLGPRAFACDLYLHMLSTWQDPLPGLYRRWRNVKRCADLVAARPAVQRMMQQNQAA